MSWYDNGMPIIDDPDVLATAELIRRLYAMPGCELGGPLHAMLDDGNIDDDQINSDYYHATDGRTIETYLCKHRMSQVGTAWRHVYEDELYCTPEVADLARLILDSFRRMTEPWRAAAIAWYDGTAWKYIERLAGQPLIGGPLSATPEQVDDLVADLRRWMTQDETPQQKACVPVPCPSFAEFNPAAEMNASGYTGRIRCEQSVDGPGVRVTRLDGGGQPIGEPITVSGWAAAGIQADDPGPENPKPTLKWVETTFSLDDPALRALYASILENTSLPPQVDVAQVLLDDAGRPPRVLYRGPASVYETPSAQDRLDQWLANPSWDAAAAPLIVGVPADADADQLAAAIATCQRAGLLPATPNGILYLPEETDL